jgi:hypothetical protein
MASDGWPLISHQTSVFMGFNVHHYQIGVPEGLKPPTSYGIDSNKFGIVGI